MNPTKPDDQGDPKPAPDGSLLGPKGDPVEGARRPATDGASDPPHEAPQPAPRP